MKQKFNWKKILYYIIFSGIVNKYLLKSAILCFALIDVFVYAYL